MPVTTVGVRTIDLDHRKHGASVFDLLVEQWNDLNPAERRGRVAECQEFGHRWADVTQCGETVYTVCQQCLIYRDASS